ncbi:MAG: hypothetical protein RLZZ598_985 [Pseudomonadota bacterium]
MAQRRPMPEPDPGGPVVGIGLRQPHYRELTERRPRLGFLEVHSENFFADGGAALAVLEQMREHYALSLHGVGLGLGSAAGIDEWHLDRLARLVERIEPVRVSDHACFARAMVNGGIAHAADLLPIPFTRVTLDILCANVQRVQERLRRPILVENLSAYLGFAEAEFAEPAFLAELSRRSGCALLLDVNNLYVNALNAQRDDDRAPPPLAAVQAWIDALPASTPIGEIHLAGHCDRGDIVIDDHGSRVCAEVWRACAHASQRFGSMVPTLIEWDTDLPTLDVLLDEARLATEWLRGTDVERGMCA